MPILAYRLIASASAWVKVVMFTPIIMLVALDMEVLEVLGVFTSTSKKFEPELSVIKEELNKLSEGRNLLEPFERLKLACEQVNQQKSVD